MRKLALVLFILLDLAVMGGASLLLYMHFSGKNFEALGLKGKPMATEEIKPVTPESLVGRPGGNSLISPPAGSTTTPVGMSTSALPGPGVESGTRNIKFTYRNPKAKSVSIRADFTGWKASAMQRDSTGIWTYQAALTPGEYAYCFTVDDKTFKDPANKRTKQIGRTFVSAILVKPHTAATAN